MTTSKPQAPPAISLTSTGVDVLSPPPNDTDIVVAGTPLHFRINLSITGYPSVVAMYAGEPVEVKFHVEEVETNTRKTLGPYTFTTPSPITGPFTFVSVPFSTGLNPPGTATFTTASGDDDGVYRVITELHFKPTATNPAAKENCVFDDRILAITAP